jgi:hypothetical protein
MRVGNWIIKQDGRDTVIHRVHPRLKRRYWYFKRAGSSVMLLYLPTSTGVTIFRRPMKLVAVQVKGHFVQAYLGDVMRYAGS